MVFLSQLRSARRYKWLCVSIVWLLCLVGWSLVSQMPDQYRAEARVKIDAATVVAPILAERRIEVDTETRNGLLIELFLGTQSIHRIAEASSVDSKSGEFDEALFDEIKDSLSMEGGDDDIFVVSMVRTDPKSAVRLLNYALTGMSEVAKSMLDYRASAELGVLEQKISDLEARSSELSQSRGASQAGQDPADPRLQVVKSELETAQKRREELKTALEQAIQAHPDLIEVVEPPVEPTAPFSPDRLLLNTLVLLSALAVTVVLAIIVNLLRPTLTTAHELQKVTGLPVLGSVRVIDCPAYRRTHRLSRIVFAVALASLGAVFVIVVMLERGGVNLHHMAA
jgi:hypothetical protein